MIHHQRFNLILFLGLILSFACAGCASKSTEGIETSIESSAEIPEEYAGAIYEAGDATYPGGYYIHTVQLPDESISIIAKWFTGDLMKWEVLAKCNPTLNPNRIFMGNKIRIPREIMTRQDPMTAEFVMESQPKSKKRPADSHAHAKNKPAQTETTSPTDQTAPEPVEDDPILFGPKGYTKD